MYGIWGLRTWKPIRMSPPSVRAAVSPHRSSTIDVMQDSTFINALQPRKMPRESPLDLNTNRSIHLKCDQARKRTSVIRWCSRLRARSRKCMTSCVREFVAFCPIRCCSSAVRSRPGPAGSTSARSCSLKTEKGQAEILLVFMRREKDECGSVSWAGNCSYSIICRSKRPPRQNTVQVSQSTLLFQRDGSWNLQRKQTPANIMNDELCFCHTGGYCSGVAQEGLSCFVRKYREPFEAF